MQPNPWRRRQRGVPRAAPVGGHPGAPAHLAGERVVAVEALVGVHGSAAGRGRRASRRPGRAGGSEGPGVVSARARSAG